MTVCSKLMIKSIPTCAHSTSAISRRWVVTSTKERVVNASITSRLDYCNSLLYGTSVNNIARLQRIHNSAARLILRRPRSDSAMPLLCILHWLPVPQRIEFKLLVFTYKAVHGDAPKYLSDLMCPCKPIRALRSANNNLLTVVRTHEKRWRQLICGRSSDLTERST